MQIYAAIRQPGNRFSPQGAIRTAALALAILACALLAPANAQQDTPNFGWKFASRMYQAVTRVTDLAQKQQANGYEFSRMGCFFGTMLPKEGTVAETFPLKEGVTYAFIATGEDKAADVDMFLYDADTDKIVKKDNVDGRTAVIVYKCPQTGKYRVVVKLYKIAPNVADNVDAAICSMTVMQKGDPNTSCKITGDILKKTVTRCLQRCSEATVGYPSRFHEGENTWAIIGTVIGKDEAIGQDPKKFEAGRHAFVGASSNEGICNYFALRDVENKKLAGACVMDDTDDKPDSPYKNYLFRLHTQNRAYVVLQGQKFMEGREKSGDQGLSLVVTAILDQPEDDETADENKIKDDAKQSKDDNNN